MSEPQPPAPDELVDVRNLRMYFPILKGVLKRQVGEVKAVDDISFAVRDRETLGLVGESGCGKTTTGRLLMRAFEPTGGSIHFKAPTADEPIDITTLTGYDLFDYWRQAQMIFQDPYSSLNPRMTVLQIVGEPLLCLTDLNEPARRQRVRELLDIVGLDPSYANRYPHAFSGGQRQRIGIARALAVRPKLIVADEAVSALDVSIQAQILNLLKRLQRELGLSYLFVSHDLGVVRHISHRVAVMYVGKLVEVGETESLFSRPRHPYTEALLAAVPQPDPDHKIQLRGLQGEVADPANRPAGCCFHPRCPYATEECRVDEPPLVPIQSADAQPPRLVACHHAERLTLAGVAAETSRSEGEPRAQHF